MNINSVYVEGVAAFKTLQTRTKSSFQLLKESSLSQRVANIQTRAQHTFDVLKTNTITRLNQGGLPDDYSHIYRRKARWELVVLSGAVCGIEFCYAAETAFVSPILLGLGVQVRLMTLVWCLSPLIGFFLTPVLGSLSDKCYSGLGRRRPFIILLSLGIIVGLIFVPNGKDIGLYLGDRDELFYEEVENITSTGYVTRYDMFGSTNVPKVVPEGSTNFITKTQFQTETTTVFNISRYEVVRHHPWGIVFTVVGTVLLDLCSDSCQSPARTYLLDVTVVEDHALGLSTFTIMAGLGGSIGYAMGGINWKSTVIGKIFRSHVRAVFTIVAVLFVVCLVATISSFREIPLDVLLHNTAEMTQKKQIKAHGGKYQKFTNEDDEETESVQIGNEWYGSTRQNGNITDTGETFVLNDLSPINKYFAITDESENAKSDPNHLKEAINSNYCGKERLNQFYPIGNVDDLGTNLKNTFATSDDTFGPQTQPTLKEYLKSIVFMPNSLRILCLTNLFCWSSLVCYSLYFTDFVGEVIFEGDPKAPDGSPLNLRYYEGVQYGCWGMAVYSLSCSTYSYIIETLVKRFVRKDNGRKSTDVIARTRYWNRCSYRR
ncbi:loss of visual transmission isoform X2 [Tachypleus tridentatus]|uniref:loss of visual transmission isoform X2 n=1 Tax=Tachypleus tridentatus TaxID=6853 RepID=UPI003FD220AC